MASLVSSSVQALLRLAAMMRMFPLEGRPSPDSQGGGSLKLRENPVSFRQPCARSIAVPRAAIVPGHRGCFEGDLD
jgi:hypothetical protein